MKENNTNNSTYIPFDATPEQEEAIHRASLFLGKAYSTLYFANIDNFADDTLTLFRDLRRELSINPSSGRRKGSEEAYNACQGN